jgi:hypothetical protein
MINSHGYDESVWGSLAQRQTIYGIPKPHVQGYAGFEMLEIRHPYDDLPRMPLDERFRSFSERLADARSRFARRIQ